MSRNWENIYTIHYDTPTTELSAEQNNGAIESGQLVDGKVESCLRSRKNKQLDREKNLWYNIF